MSPSRVVFVVLFFAALLVPSTAAHASSSVVCSGYSSCSDKGYSHAGYANHKSTSYWRMYTGTNCTNYVAFRLVTTNGMPNVRPKSGVGNAEDWGRAMSSITDTSPNVGSVAWWGRTGHHVAYVERVVSSSEIWVSESNWSGSFDWRKITKSGSGWPDGFIHFADRKIVNKGKPSIIGTVKVGTSLTAAGGDWSPKGNTYSYRWLSGGKAISGATGKKFTPTVAQLARPLAVRVTATRASYPTAKVTSPARTVHPGTLRATKAPTISGTARVDETLTASAGTWTPTGSTYAYQWLVDGKAVPGATSSRFAPGPQHVDGRVTVRVAATKTGYDKITAGSAPTRALAPGLLSSTRKPSISGSAKVGSLMAALPGSWSETGLTYRYQWVVNGTAVSGADAATFAPRAVDHGLTVRVRVTANRTGYTTTTAISAPSGIVTRGAFTLRSRPTVTGPARVGSRLTASTGMWSPSGTYTYQWYADDRPVSGATGRTFIPGTSQRGDKIRAQITARRDGFTTSTARSVNTPAVAYGHISVSTVPSITGSTRLGSVLSVSAGTHTPTGAARSYQWLRNGTVLTGATGSTHRVKTGDLGRTLSVRVKLSASGYSSRTVTTHAVGPAKATSSLHVSAAPSRRTVSFTIRVSAAGAASPDGSVSVLYAGSKRRTVAVRDGRAVLSLGSQTSGPHTYRFSFGGTSTVTSDTYSKKVTIG